MKSIRLILSATCLLFLLCATVQAQHVGPYLGLSLGGNILDTADSEDSAGTFNLRFDPALHGSVALGWDLSPGHAAGEGRVELEFARRSNQLDQVEFREGRVSADGKLTVESLLVNTFGVYRSESRWTPYIGAGLGAARLTADALQVTGEALADDETVVFAYQAGAGVEYALTDAFMLDLGYRFFSTLRPKFTEADGRRFETEYLSHSVILGARLGF